MGFFDEPQGAAIFKHAVLAGYLPTWASKVGRFAPGGRVAYLDGYAGAGAYGDGTPASPALALDVAKELEKLRDVQCYFVENDPAIYEQLSDLVSASSAADRAHVLDGDIAGHLDSILNEIGHAPLFAFLDPFGTGLPFRQLTDQLLSRPRTVNGRRYAQTEVLINFVHAGVYRNAGKLDLGSDNPAQIASAEAIVERVDRNLGGTWWQSTWRDLAEPDGVTAAAVQAIRDDYIDRVLTNIGDSWQCYVLPISDVWRGKTIYDLLLFTQHAQGYWFFNEAVSLGRQVFHKHCDPDSEFVLQMFDPEDDWVAIIESNIRTRLDAGTQVPLIKQVDEVYGETLGYARAKHVRKAIKRLHAEGHTPTKGTGEIVNMVVLPPDDPGPPRAGAVGSRSA